MSSDAVTQARQHSVGDLLRRTARRHPDKIAVINGDRRVTYAEFDASVNRCAHALAVQTTQVRRPCRHPAQEPQRQDPQAGAARRILRPRRHHLIDDLAQRWGERDA